MNSQHDDDHWLVRPATIRLLWRVFAVILALTILGHAVIDVRGHYGIEVLWGFTAVYGFLCCVFMVFAAKFLGKFLKRDENYYREDQDDV